MFSELICSLSVFGKLAGIVIDKKRCVLSCFYSIWGRYLIVFAGWPSSAGLFEYLSQITVFSAGGFEVEKQVFYAYPEKIEGVL